MRQLPWRILICVNFLKCAGVFFWNTGAKLFFAQLIHRFLMLSSVQSDPVDF